MSVYIVSIVKAYIEYMVSENIVSIVKAYIESTW